MKRHHITPRGNWQTKLEEIGFGFHTTNLPYWNESACYSFTMNEVLFIEAMTAELWGLCLDAVQYVIDQKQYARFHIPEWMAPMIEKSWYEDDPSIYGRFDFCYHEGTLKLLEFNADTPTALFEMAVVQWFWLQECYPQKDQFNSAHERLVAYWAYLQPYLHPAPLYFSCVKKSLEDLTTVEYLRDCAMQAGLDTNLVFMDDIGWNGKDFTNLQHQAIKNLFKLYPWEFMVREPFGQHLPAVDVYWIEPPWKMILSNKAILAILYQLFGDHDCILPAAFEPLREGSFVKKPLLGREGANIEIIKQGRAVERTKGDYGSEGFIYQQLAELPCFDGNYPLVGSWVIGQEPAGVGIREASTLITNNTSRFVPHYIEDGL